MTSSSIVHAIWPMGGGHRHILDITVGLLYPPDEKRNIYINVYILMIDRSSTFRRHSRYGKCG